MLHLSNLSFDGMMNGSMSEEDKVFIREACLLMNIDSEELENTLCANLMVRYTLFDGVSCALGCSKREVACGQ